jgi:hypothetical protein
MRICYCRGCHRADHRYAAQGDIDYLNSQYRRAAPSTPGTLVMDAKDSMPMPDSSITAPPIMPSTLDAFTHILLHAFLLALCILSLIALWNHASVATFAVFIAWTVCFYFVILVLAWQGIPSRSILTVIINRLRDPPVPQPSVISPPTAYAESAMNGPYQHQPSYRLAQDSEYPTSVSHGGITVEDDDDDDVDEETRQRRIEEEINRRDVNIVTVPKRRLFLMNPESS